MIKEKNCKAQGRAKGYKNACGNLTNVERLKFGLCPTCVYDWATTTDDGKIWYQKQFLPRVSKKTEKRQKEERLREKNITRQMKIDVMSSSEYREKFLYGVFQEIARLIDHEQKCIVTDREHDLIDGGHFKSKGHNVTIALNLHNIHAESRYSNGNGSDSLKYFKGLKRVYGENYADFCDVLTRCPDLKLTKDEMQDIYRKALVIRNELKKDLRVFEAEERIALRNHVNLELGIYEKEFAVFGNAKLLAV